MVGVIVLIRIALCGALAAAIPMAQAADPYASRPDGPRIVLIQQDGKASPLGTTAPSFALYGDRTVIFRARPPVRVPSGFLSTRLTDTQHQALMAGIAPEALAKLGESYVAATSAEPPGYVLHLWVNGRVKSISAFGDLSHPATQAAFPPELLRALRTMTEHSIPGGHWVPSRFILHLWPMDHARKAGMPWPPDLPPANHPNDRMNDRINEYGLPSAQFAAVHRLVSRLEPGQAVRVAERDWAVSYRLPFPHEDAWFTRSGEPEFIALPSPAPVPAKAAAPVAEPRVVFELMGGRGGYGGPLFALYADGRVIFPAPFESKVPSGHLSARLPESRYRELIDAIAPESLDSLGDHYDAVTGTDPVVNVIHVWIKGRRKTVSVSGHLSPMPRGMDGRAKAPAEFLRAYDAIARFTTPAIPWMPQSLELLLWPRERFQEPVMAWPAGWPLPERAPGNRNGLRRISLPAAEFKRLMALIPPEVAVRTMSIGKHRWSVSYHLPFPLEATWRCYGKDRSCGAN